MEDSDTLAPDMLAAMLVRMFEFAPIAFAITTSDTKTSSYAKVNDAYLRLTGLQWEDIRGKTLIDDGAAIDNPARDERHRMLAEEGSYVLEEVDLMHVDGTIIPTLISAQRTIVDGVSYDVEVIIDVSARVKMQREMERALRISARTDALSGLPNRAYFDEFVNEQIVERRFSHRPLALAFIDLNGFKAINDSLGHDAGDRVLQVVSDRLRQNCRASDFIARIGGDEFALVLEAPTLSADEMVHMLRGIMDRVFAPLTLDGLAVQLGAAVGVSFLQSELDTPATLLKRADQCMYLAKSSGVALKVVGNR